MSTHCTAIWFSFVQDAENVEGWEESVLFPVKNVKNDLQNTETHGIISISARIPP